MIELPAPNTITRPYRGLSVQEVEVPLTELDLVPFLLGRLGEAVYGVWALIGSVFADEGADAQLAAGLDAQPPSAWSPLGVMRAHDGLM